MFARGWSQYPLRALSINPVYLPLAFSHPRIFMAHVNDPTICPTGLPVNVWEDVNKVARAIKSKFEDRETHLDFLAAQAGKLVRRSS